MKYRNFPGGPELRVHAFISGDTGSIPGWVTKISHAVWLSQNNNNKYKQSVIEVKLFSQLCKKKVQL